MTTLYSTQAAAATTSDLYILNMTTAAPTSIGPTGHAFTSLAFDPTDGTLYGTTSAQSTSNPGSLFTLNPTTGAATLVGSMGGTVSDIAIDTGGQMYGWTRRTSNGGLGGTYAAFLSIDKTNASYSIVSSTGQNYQAGGISFHSDGTLYGLLALSATAELYSINKSTGALTVLSAFSPTETIVSSATFDSADLLWYLTGGAGGTTNINLKNVNVTTFSRTTIGDPGDNFDALAIKILAGPSRPNPATVPGLHAVYHNGAWHMIPSNAI